jgi:hypothetical protein
MAQRRDVTVRHVDIENLLDGNRSTSPFAFPDLSETTSTDFAFETNLVVANEKAALCCRDGIVSGHGWPINAAH